MLKSKTLTKENDKFDLLMTIAQLILRISIAVTLILVCISVLFLMYTHGYFGVSDLLDKLFIFIFSLLTIIIIFKTLMAGIKKYAN
jgi:hypothetical protein